MKLKQRQEDFRVRELVRPDYVGANGAWRVFRVTKRKLTSLEAAARLAAEAGVDAGDVAIAGLKDRQGVTTQFMAIHQGRDVVIDQADLKVEPVGFASERLESDDSEGNAFEIVVRELNEADLAVLRGNVPVVRDLGVVNYFDEQRFGNLRHDQGWIALDLIHGKVEQALRKLIATPSPSDDDQTRAFKSALEARWGDWSHCREIAGSFGQHHSIFDYLKKNPDDFAGAFFHVATRVRLIHLYAYQSHVWNRAVAATLRARLSPDETLIVGSEEGSLVFPTKRVAALDELGEWFRLPGPGLADVVDPIQRAAIEVVLAREKVSAADFRIDGVSGFQLKGEDRPLFLRPQHLRVRPPERDALNVGFKAVRVRFDLPRGAYATLVIKRLLASPRGDEDGPRSRGWSPPRTRDHGAFRQEGFRGRPREPRGHFDDRPRESRGHFDDRREPRGRFEGERRRPRDDFERGSGGPRGHGDRPPFRRDDRPRGQGRGPRRFEERRPRWADDERRPAWTPDRPDRGPRQPERPLDRGDRPFPRPFDRNDRRGRFDRPDRDRPRHGDYRERRPEGGDRNLRGGDLPPRPFDRSDRPPRSGDRRRAPRWSDDPPRPGPRDDRGRRPYRGPRDHGPRPPRPDEPGEST